ncbi:MAG TPA: hypothetical protein VFT01_02010, partial [Homoserinimonas sp.]|nr:hypothetical protein [Homoserinimonas sp.]
MEVAMIEHNMDPSEPLLEVPQLPSIWDPLGEEAEFAKLVERLRDSDGPPDGAAVRDFKTLTLKQLFDQVDFERTRL